jgi:phosphatidylserine/phosphatidylglycerophosphate/cardiolipin synthase-like enzyme
MRPCPPSEVAGAPAGLGTLETRYFPPPGGTDAAPFSRSGTVLPLVDGVQFFQAVQAEVGRLALGDSWYVTGWLFQPGFRFGAGGPTLESLLFAKAAAGVDVRVVLWANRLLLETRSSGGSIAEAYRRVTEANVGAAERLRSLTAPSGAALLAGRVLLDWSGNAASSHHMKLNVTVRGGAVTAFAGGLDYWPDRYDAAPHTAMPVLLPDGRSVPWGWHDAGIAVTGAPAHRVLDTFRTRWTEAATLSPAT